MKKLIITMILLTILIGENKHFNPNGHPFTLNISAQIEDSKAFSNIDGITVIEFKIPITTWITIKGGIHNDRYKNLAEGFQDWENNEFKNFDEKLNYSQAYEVIHYGIEAHIPLYKLWQ